MAVNLKRYIENPKQEISRKVAKIGIKIQRKARLAGECLAGNYTSKTIGESWVGKPLRMDLMKALVARHGYKKYLEIGCRGDETFSVVACEMKVGVDPASGGTHRMTSDAFFAQNKEMFDLIFIDGLHTYEQVKLDIINSVKVLNDGGTIVLDDCLPLSCKAQFQFPLINAWNGDVWKALVEARTQAHIDTATCLIDHGQGIIKKRPNSKPLSLDVSNFRALKYEFLVDDYKRLMNTISYEQALAFTD